MTEADLATDGSFGLEREEFLREVLAGLTQRPRSVPGKFLWDEAGSILFDRICDSPDYYPTQREMTLMPEVVRDVASLVGPGATIVEFGSGASRKIRALLDALDRPARYIAVDISRTYLETSVRRLAPEYPAVEMIPICIDYSKPFTLPDGIVRGPTLGFFPGTSIGNLGPDEAEAFLARVRAALGPSRFLVGADPNRDGSRLLEAYGRCDGLMAAFHLNLLTRMKRELGATIEPETFRHEARVLPEPFRVEAHLVAKRPGTYRVGSREMSFAAGESIRTDVSHKHQPQAFQALAGRAGWHPERLWLETESLFSLHLLKN